MEWLDCNNYNLFLLSLISNEISKIGTDQDAQLDKPRERGWENRSLLSCRPTSRRGGD